MSEKKQEHSIKYSLKYLNLEKDKPETAEGNRLVRKIKKRDLHQYLKCQICTGFFRDATTINECLDTFCKSCIFKYFMENSNRQECPKCNTKLGGQPTNHLIQDQTIQKIVDLLYPQFKELDQKAIIKMYQTFEDTDPLPLDQKLKDYGYEGFEKIEQMRQKRLEKQQYKQKQADTKHQL